MIRNLDREGFIFTQAPGIPLGFSTYSGDIREIWKENSSAVDIIV